jgi:hypothetical protein
MGAKLESRFDFGDKVLIDGDSSIKAVVIGFKWLTKNAVVIEAAWMANGASHAGWFDDWRLEFA